MITTLEQPLPKHGACNLSSINISAYVRDPYTTSAELDIDMLVSDIPAIVKAMDDVLEENIERHALIEQQEMSRKYRNVGIGIMGLADMLVMLGIKYGSKEAIYFTSDLMRTIFRTAVLASANLAEERGNFPGYSEKVWDSTIIKYAFGESEIEGLKYKNKLRNCSLISIAPTGSIGTMLNISTGCESFFALSYTRKTVSLNNEDSYYQVDIKAVEDYKRITGNDKLPDYFITSEEIPWKQRILMQAVLQEFTDTAISSTINLKKDISIEDVKALYKYAWRTGLKGVTIFRSGSRDPILSVKSEDKEVSDELSLNTDDAKIQLNNPHELKRGEIIKSGDGWLGIKRTLMTGCGTLHVSSFWDPTTGELREIYLSKGSTGGCNHYMIGLSRMISLAARGGVKVEDILDQLKSCGVCPSYAVRSATRKDTSKGSCCPVAVGNALKEMSNEISDIICKCKESNSDILKEIPHQEEQFLEECPSCHEKTLTRQGGCISCMNCSWTRCS
jgi:ribonucleoside-diphosphate reductase alpha chain